MRKSVFVTIFVWVLLLIGMGQLDRGIAEVNIKVGINVPPPPPLVIPKPPPMYVIPRTYVYFPPEVEVDVFFYNGYWYRPHQGHWYRSENYDDRWVYISREKVPTVIINLPPNFRHVSPGHAGGGHRSGGPGGSARCGWTFVFVDDDLPGSEADGAAAEGGQPGVADYCWRRICHDEPGEDPAGLPVHRLHRGGGGGGVVGGLCGACVGSRLGAGTRVAA